jgi:sulfite oxidase
MNPLTRRQIFAALAATSLTSGADTAKRGGRVLSTRPQDYEMGLDGFLEYLTPNDRFYVRSHHYTPTLDAAAYQLEVAGEVGAPLKLSLDDLKKMPKADLVSVCECAGNGRSLYNPGMPGLQWEHGSVGNARWGGVRLADVLKRAGVKPSAKFVLFDGADVPVGKMPDFQRGIPSTKALHPDTLLAYEMNGEALPVSHGFPVRVVVPGWAGDSWVKWVTKITPMEKEADVFFMKTGYRHPGKPVTPGVAVDPTQMHPVEKLQIKSVIATPTENVGVKPNTPVRIAGAAWAGGVPVAGVDVSVDRGRTWRPATLGTERHTYGWRLWHFDWKPAVTGHYIVMARARTATGETQPFEPEWNPSGYFWNVVQRVPVHVSDNPVQPAPAPAPVVPTPDAPLAYKQTCNGCHDDTVVVQQRLTRAQWDREITKMTNWGAPVKADQRNELLDFLSSRFGLRR